MGIWKNIRLAREYAQVSETAIPYWGRIVRVGRKIGPLVNLDVEIHSGMTPPHVEKILTSPPRGMRPQAGQDVYVSRSYGGRDHTVYYVDWNRPPRYGTDQAPAGGSAAEQGKAAMHPAQQVQQLKLELSAGRITHEEFLRAWKAIMRGNQ